MTTREKDPAANDAVTPKSTDMPTLAERWASYNKVAVDLVAGMSMQAWTLVFMFNPHLALISSLMRPKNKPRDSE